MFALKYAAIALISGPFVWTGILMALKGIRAGAATFAVAGLALITLMSASALAAVEQIDAYKEASPRERMAMDNHEKEDGWASLNRLIGQN